MASRAQESSVHRRNTFLTLETYNCVTSYTIGGDNFQSRAHRAIDRVEVFPFTRQGLRALVVTGSVTGNRFRIQLFRATGVDSVGRFTGEVASATDLGTDAFTVIEEGT